MDIENKQVKEIYNRWNKVFHYQENSMETRLKAHSILQVIRSLVAIYEMDEVLHEEDIDDLLISWSKDMRPLFPEEKAKFLESIRKQREEGKPDKSLRPDGSIYRNGKQIKERE